LLALAFLTLPAVVLGCRTDDLHLQDTDAFTPSGRISYEVWPGNAQRRSGTLLDLVTRSSTDATMQSLGIQPPLSTGLALDSTEVRLRNADVEATGEQLTAGFLLGDRASVRPIALFDLYAQYTAATADDWRAFDETEIGVELNLVRNVSLYGGYRWWSYEESFSPDSDWDIEIRGPTAGASLKF
jgi:hypothetical protein